MRDGSSTIWRPRGMSAPPGRPTMHGCQLAEPDTITSPEVTFFMIVTPRDVVIADYAVRSYAKIRDLDFSLRVYSNYLLPEQKDYYFPRWEKLPYVDVV